MGEGLPVARVCVMVSPIHLDRPFEYSVPAELSETARPGCRVRVRFAGRKADGFVLSREAAAAHPGRLLAIEDVCGPTVLAPEILRLARSVADRYVGTLPQILRDAVPRRHLRAERSAAASTPAPLGAGSPQVPVPAADAFPWGHYGDAPDRRARMGCPGSDPVRAALTVATGHDPVAAIGDLVSGAVGAGPCLVVAPDGRAVSRLAGELLGRLGPARVERLTAEMGTGARYLAHLRILAGEVDVVVGTRSAAFAPLRRLVLAVLWDDGDDVLAEPHHPGWHAREVLALRSRQQESSLVFAGRSRTVAVARMVATGYLASWQPDRACARDARPDVSVADAELEGDGGPRARRFPASAFRALRAALKDGPVLVQVARTGYVPGVACRHCREPARCERCGGPLGLDGERQASCRWCGRGADGFRCNSCGRTALRALALGSGRIAEELGRAFPGVPVMMSSGDQVIHEEVPDEAAIVVATVGAEPAVAGGYAAAILLDGDRMLARPDLSAEEETIRRWLAAIALVRDRSLGGAAVIVADHRQRAVQAVLRADPVGWSERELAEREQAHLPPAAVVARIVGAPGPARDIVDRLEAVTAGTVLGPTPVPGEGHSESGTVARVRYLVLVPRARQRELARDLRAGLVSQSADGSQVLPSVRIDPPTLG